MGFPPYVIEVAVAPVEIQALDGEELVGGDVDRAVDGGAGAVADLLEQPVVGRGSREGLLRTPHGELRLGMELRLLAHGFLALSLFFSAFPSFFFPRLPFFPGSVSA